MKIIEFIFRLIISIILGIILVVLSILLFPFVGFDMPTHRRPIRKSSTDDVIGI